MKNSSELKANTDLQKAVTRYGLVYPPDPASMFVSLHKRQALLFIVFFIAFSAFVTDIVDLREELCILSSPYSSLESNITAGIISHSSLLPEPIFILRSAQKKRSVRISFLHLLPYGFRAPPPGLS